MTRDSADIKKIKDLIQLMDEHQLAELEISHGENRISLKRAQAQVQPTITAMPLLSPQVMPGMTGPLPQVPGSPPTGDEGLTSILSPIVGTFYAGASPDSDPFVEIGTRVEPQTVVCIIEAMKVMNEIKSEVSGTLVEVSVTNGQAVEYGQVLFKVRPD